jgi:hypothetical protein
MLVAVWQGRLTIGVVAFALAFSGLLIWWTRLRPTNDHVWADDVARMTTGTVDGDRVTLHNVRNFDWRSPSDHIQRWETRSYDLDRLQSVDMIMSYWAGPAIAHMLISFGFDDGSYVVFSVEVRRQKTQEFSEVGGFFKEFELSIVAANETSFASAPTYAASMPISIGCSSPYRPCVHCFWATSARRTVSSRPRGSTIRLPSTAPLSSTT